MWPGWVLLIHSRSEEEEGLHTASLILPPQFGASHIEVNYPTPCGGRVNRYLSHSDWFLHNVIYEYDTVKQSTNQTFL